MRFHTYSIKIKLKYQMIVINLHNQGEAIALEKYGCQGARYWVVGEVIVKKSWQPETQFKARNPHKMLDAVVCTCNSSTPQKMGNGDRKSLGSCRPVSLTHTAESAIAAAAKKSALIFKKKVGMRDQLKKVVFWRTQVHPLPHTPPHMSHIHSHTCHTYTCHTQSHTCHTHEGLYAKSIPYMEKW